MDLPIRTTLSAPAPPYLRRMPVDYTDETLPNGLRLLIAEDHLAPSATAVLTYDVGARHERAGQREMAHLFEHLMFAGSKHVARGEHFQLLADAGATVNAMTSSDYTTYFETLPSHKLELGLWLEAERLANLEVTQEGLDNQREVVWNEHRQRRENVPYGSAGENMRERLFPPGHPYHSSMAEHANLADMTVAGLQEFFDTYYAPNNAVLCVTGDVDSGQVRDLVGTYLGAIPGRPDIPRPADPELAPLGGEVRETFRERVPVPKVIVGWRAPAAGTPATDAADVLAAVLGNGRASRLTRLLVHEQELATEVTASMGGLAGGVSVFSASATARSGVAADALEAALHAGIDDLLTTAISKDDTERALALLERSLLQHLAHPIRRGLLLTVEATLHGDPDRVNTMLDRYRAVTADDLQRVAREIFRPDNRVVLTYLPESS